MWWKNHIQTDVQTWFAFILWTNFWVSKRTRPLKVSLGYHILWHSRDVWHYIGCNDIPNLLLVAARSELEIHVCTSAIKQTSSMRVFLKIESLSRWLLPVIVSNQFTARVARPDSAAHVEYRDRNSVKTGSHRDLGEKRETYTLCEEPLPVHR